MRDLLAAGRYRNVVFNLDQCGHSHVGRQTQSRSCEPIRRLKSSTPSRSRRRSPSFRSPSRSSARPATPSRVGPTQLGIERDMRRAPGSDRRTDRLERTGPARPISPFSLTIRTVALLADPFANVYRARQVYNNVLHDNSSMQPFRGSGLNMLSYDPRHYDGALYLFDCRPATGDRAVDRGYPGSRVRVWRRARSIGILREHLQRDARARRRCDRAISITPTLKCLRPAVANAAKPHDRARRCPSPQENRRASFRCSSRGKAR